VCRKEENHIQELAELIHAYCPAGKVDSILCCDVMQLILLVYTLTGGVVMDLYAGTCVVGEAALLTGRRCMMGDKDAIVFNLGYNRCKLYYTMLKKSLMLRKPGEEVPFTNTQAVLEWMLALPVTLQPKNATAFWKVCVSLFAIFV
jgi:hypothetical protein